MIQVKDNRRGVSNKFLLGIILYLSNPSVLITLTGLIAFIKSFELFVMTGSYGVLFSIGTGLGVFLWFLCLIKIVDKLELKMGQKTLFKLNHVDYYSIFGVLFSFRALI